VGGLITKRCIFHGVEQRGTLVSAAKAVAKKYAVPGVSFLHANAEDVQWKNYDAIYLYNPFWENMDETCKIDDSINVHAALLARYVRMTRDKLSTLRSGSRALIYHGFGGDMPPGFELLHHERISGSDLTVWEKN
jgi:hypothetical protein